MKDLLISGVAAAVASLGLTAATLLVAGRFLGEKLFGHWLDGRLQRQKEAHELKLEEFKGEQDQQIEELRGDIGYRQDRGKHSNEREYAALTEIWEKFSDLRTATNNSVVDYLRFPDLKQMDDTRVAKFLDKHDFTEAERAAVRNAANKNDGFSSVMTVRSIAEAESAYFDFRARFDKQNIFIPKALSDSLYDAADLCLRASKLRDAEFLDSGSKALRKLNDAVRERLHRE